MAEDGLCDATLDILLDFLQLLDNPLPLERRFVGDPCIVTLLLGDSIPIVILLLRVPRAVVGLNDMRLLFSDDPRAADIGLREDVGLLVLPLTGRAEAGRPNGVPEPRAEDITSLLCEL